MSFLGSLGGALGGLVGGLFGGAASKPPQVNFTPLGFNAGGLVAQYGNGGYTVAPTSNRSAQVAGVAQTFGNQSDALGGLLNQWTPGSSALRTALTGLQNSQIAQLQSNRDAALGNLRDNLASRRILGSSFAQNSLANADQTYQKTIADVMQQNQVAQANTFLQELQASQTLIQQQYTAARGQYQSILDEMNLEGDVASRLTMQASSLMENAATVQAQLDAKAAAGAGSFFGNIGTQLGSAAGKFLGGSSLFGGGSAAAGAAADPLAAGGSDVAALAGDALALV